MTQVWSYSHYIINVSTGSIWHEVTELLLPVMTFYNFMFLSPGTLYHKTAFATKMRCSFRHCLAINGPLARYAKLCVAHAPGTFSTPLRTSDPNMHHGTCVTHVPWCMPGSLTSGFLWSRWRGECSWNSRRMHNPQFYVSGKRSVASIIRFCWSNDSVDDCRR